jgi:hypothetical protein
MPWKCPSCTQEIRHDPTDDAPRLGVLYRCHVCRMELVLDGTSGALLASTLMSSATADDSGPADPSTSS